MLIGREKEKTCRERGQQVLLIAAKLKTIVSVPNR